MERKCHIHVLCNSNVIDIEDYTHASGFSPEIFVSVVKT